MRCDQVIPYVGCLENPSSSVSSPLIMYISNTYPSFQVSYAEGLGISNERGSVLLMILGGATATGRICFGKIVQYGFINRLNMHQVSMIITGAGTMMLSLITSFGGLVVYVICIGLVDGCYVVLLPLLTATLVGEDKAVLAWGFLVGACSITFTIGPPVAGNSTNYVNSNCCQRRIMSTVTNRGCYQ